MKLSRDAILESSDLKTESVAVPEWGGEIIISTMTGTARDAWEASLIDKGGKVNMANIRARLVVACAVDEAGNRLFSDGDAVALGAKSGAALERCAKIAQRINSLTEKDIEEAKGN